MTRRTTPCSIWSAPTRRSGPTAATNDVYGFTGRDDRKPFSGKDGVVYYPTGTPEVAEGVRDALTGYGLRPLSEIQEHMDDPSTFDGDDTIAGTDLPRRFEGNEGIDDSAVPPWAWGHWHEEESNRDDNFDEDRTEWFQEGDLFNDPAKTIKMLFEVPTDFSSDYVLTLRRNVVDEAAGVTDRLTLR